MNQIQLIDDCIIEHDETTDLDTYSNKKRAENGYEIQKIQQIVLKRKGENFSACKKKNPKVVIELYKQRCHSKNERALYSALIADIRRHIKSFQALYYHVSSTNKYFVGSLTLADMYRMYVMSCQEKDEPNAKYVKLKMNLFISENNTNLLRLHT